MKNRSTKRLAPRPIGILATVITVSGTLVAITCAQEAGSCCATTTTTQAEKQVEQVAQAAAHIAKEEKSSCSAAEKTTSQFALADYQIIEQKANTFTSNSQEGTVLDIDSQGNLLVAWGSRRQEQGNFGVFAQRFDPLGRPLGTEIRINQYAPNAQQDPAVAFGADDQATVTWMSFNQDSYQGDVAEHPGAGEIYARQFATSCCGEFGPTGDEFRVNETIKGHQESPAVTVNKDGQALFTWTNNLDGRQTVMGRIFAADATPLSGEFKLSNCCSTSFKDQLASAVSLPDGRFATVWARAN